MQARSCRAVDTVDQDVGSCVNRSPLMQRIPVERTGVQIPALAHPLPGALPCRLLLRCRHTPTADRHQPGNRLAVAGDDEFLASTARTQRAKLWLASRRVTALLMRHDVARSVLHTILCGAVALWPHGRRTRAATTGPQTRLRPVTRHPPRRPARPPLHGHETCAPPLCPSTADLFSLVDACYPGSDTPGGAKRHAADQEERFTRRLRLRAILLARCSIDPVHEARRH